MYNGKIAEDVRAGVVQRLLAMLQPVTAGPVR
jgi:hypothetical protein